MVAILPVKVIWTLQIPKQQRIALVGILTIGWFVCVVSILRLTALVELSKHPEDRTYYAAPTAYWSAIEANLGIVCASLPALKPLIVRIIPAFSTRSRSREYGERQSAHMGANYELASKATRGNEDDDRGSTATPVLNVEAYSSKTEHQEFGKSIYVTQQVEQHSEDGQSSDSESQKDLVTCSTFPSPHAR
jgi:hypothetical protein